VLTAGSGPEMAGAGELRELGLWDLKAALYRRLHQGEDDLDPGKIDAVDGGELPDEPDSFDVTARIAAPLGGGRSGAIRFSLS